jgi:hypothetical protein
MTVYPTFPNISIVNSQLAYKSVNLAFSFGTETLPMAPRTMDTDKPARTSAAADAKGSKQKPAKKTPAAPPKKASPPAKKR